MWKTAVCAVRRADHIQAGLRILFCAVGCMVVAAGVEAQPVEFAVIGDFGADNAGEQKVADMVAAWDPDFVVTVGDNRYGSRTMDTAIGQYYCDFIRGAKAGPFCSGNRARKNAFFPALGNHDYHDNDGVDEYLSYFRLPGDGFSNSSGNERYYDFVWGPVHFYMLNSMRYEPHGTTSTSRQALWLKSRLAASTSPWNVVLLHFPPYSSGKHGSYSELQWPYEDWGADVVLAGHDHTYERVMKSGFPYFVNGLGGGKRYECGTRVPGSVTCYDGDFGAQLVKATDSNISFEFFRVNGASGVLVDKLELSKRANIRPVARIATNGTIGSVPLKVRFDGSGSTDSDGSISSYRWYVEGLESKSGRQVSYTFFRPGTYEVRLEVTDDDGSTDSEQFVVTAASKQRIHVLQDGIAGYRGTTDTYIRRDQTGRNFGDDEMLSASGSPDKAILVRWDLEDILPGTPIENAEIRFTVDQASGRDYELYAVNRSWIENQATWRQRSDASNWSSTGLSAPNDHGESVLGQLDGRHRGMVSIPLADSGVETIQRWVDDPATNYGVVIKDYAGDGHLQVLSSENSQADRRPSLILFTEPTVVAVKLEFLEVMPQHKRAQLTWETATGSDIAAFGVEYAAPGAAYVEVAVHTGMTGDSSARRYTYTLDVPHSGMYRFRLRQIARDGSATYSEEIEVYIPGDSALQLQGPYPNPTRATATGRFVVQDSQPVRGELFDSLGRMREVFYAGTPVAGIPEAIIIDLSPYPAGVYYLRVRGDTFHELRSIIRAD